MGPFIRRRHKSNILSSDNIVLCKILLIIVKMDSVSASFTTEEQKPIFTLAGEPSATETTVSTYDFFKFIYPQLR